MIEKSAAIWNCWHDRSAVMEITQMFMADIPRYRSTIEGAVERADATQLAFSAHKLRGSLSVFGADSAAEVAGKLATVSKAGDLLAARELLPRLNNELTRVTGDLHDLLQDEVNLVVRG